MTAAHVIQRPLRGSRISTFYPVKRLPSLSSLDSAFQLQEYISLLIRLNVHDVDSIVSLPGTSKKDREVAREKDGGAEGPKDEDKEYDKKSEIQVDQACWIYEQLRRLAQDLSHPLITTLQQECTRATCPEMKAGEWLYLCVAHGNDGAMEQCCAIDYILHTVDSATALLNSPRTFPSRLQIPPTSHRHFSSLARRLGRIFAHAYFSHREVFEQAEAESSLYARFLALTSIFDLVPAEFLVIPSNQEGHKNTDAERDFIRDAHQQYSRQQPTESSSSSTQFMTSTLAPKPHTQQDLGLLGSRSKSPMILSRKRSNNALFSSSSSSTSRIDDSTGEHSTEARAGTNNNNNNNNNGRSRFGRNRTDTMVFADVEASGVVDELAAKARAGEFDVGFEADNSSPVESEVRPPVADPDEHEPPEQQQESEELGPEDQFDILLAVNPGLGVSEPDVVAHGGGGVMEDDDILGEQRPSADSEIPTGDSFSTVDSAMMDNHIRATIAEGEEEPEEEEEGEEEEEEDLAGEHTQRLDLASGENDTRTVGADETVAEEEVVTSPSDEPPLESEATKDSEPAEKDIGEFDGNPTSPPTNAASDNVIVNPETPDVLPPLAT